MKAIFIKVFIFNIQQYFTTYEVASSGRKQNNSQGKTREVRETNELTYIIKLKAYSAKTIYSSNYKFQEQNC